MTPSLLAGIWPKLPQAIATRLFGTGREMIMRIDIPGEVERRSLFSELVTPTLGRFRMIHGNIDNI